MRCVGLRGLFVLSAVSLAGCPSDEVNQGRDTDETSSTSTSSSSSTTSSPTGPSTNTASQSDSDTTDPTSSSTDPSESTTTDATSTTTDGTGTDGTTGGGTGSTGDDGNFACADDTLTGAFPLVDMGTIGMGDGDDFEAGEPCSPGTGGFDLAFTFTAPAAGNYVVSTLDTSFDTVLMVFDECDGTLLQCNDDINFDQNIVTSAVQVMLEADQTILIVVDSYDETESGAYTLTIEPQA